MDKLTLNHLSASYGKNIVFQDVQIELVSQSMNFIIGANGCGKTTLLKCINSLKDYQGEILLNNRNLKDLKRNELAKEVAMISQISDVSFSYSLYETVLMGRYAHKRDVLSSYSKEDEEITLDCLKRVGLLNEKEKMLHTCSGGQLQRVYIARMLAQNPKVVLLDEMTNHLDIKYQIELLSFIREWAKSEDKIILGVLHDLNLVNSFADKVYLLDEGCIKREGTPRNVLGSNDLSKAFSMDIRTWMLKSAKLWEDVE